MKESLTESDAQGSMICLSCGASIPIQPGYTPWCDQCDWNLKPQQPRAPNTIFESLYARAGSRLGDKLFADVAHDDPEQPRLSISQPLAYLCAGSVHLLTVSVAIAGFVLLATAAGRAWMLVVGALCLAIAWFVRPRVARSSPKGIARDQAPQLYSLVDRVATAVGTPPVGSIVLTASFNASLSREGWRGTWVLTLGLRLLSILDNEERIALIAHELAHEINGDVARSRIITLALSSLSRWYAVLRPLRIALSLGFTEIVYLYAGLLSHLCWRTSQRAEYRADLCAAEVAGTEAMLSLLDKLHLTAVITAAPLGPRNLDGRTVFDELRCRLAAVPPREVERIRRVERLRQSALDATHPPTAYRIALLEETPTGAPKVVLPDDEEAELSAELMRIERTAHQKIVDALRQPDGKAVP